MIQEYFPLRTLLGIVTGCNKELAQYVSEFKVLDYMQGRIVAPSEYAIVLVRCRAKILELYPGLLIENSSKDRVAYFIGEEQNLILIKMRERFKTLLKNDCLPIPQLAKL